MASAATRGYRHSWPGLGTLCAASFSATRRGSVTDHSRPRGGPSGLEEVVRRSRGSAPAARRRSGRGSLPSGSAEDPQQVLKLGSTWDDFRSAPSAGCCPCLARPLRGDGRRICRRGLGAHGAGTCGAKSRWRLTGRGGVAWPNPRRRIRKIGTRAKWAVAAAGGRRPWRGEVVSAPRGRTLRHRRRRPLDGRRSAA